MTLAIHDIAASRFFFVLALFNNAQLLTVARAVSVDWQSLCRVEVTLPRSVNSLLPGSFRNIANHCTTRPTGYRDICWIDDGNGDDFFQGTGALQTSLKSVNRDDWWLTGHNRHGSVITHYSTAAQSCSGWGQLPLSLKAKLNQTVLSWELLVLKLCIFWS